MAICFRISTSGAASPPAPGNVLVGGEQVVPCAAALDSRCSRAPAGSLGKLAQRPQRVADPRCWPPATPGASPSLFIRLGVEAHAAIVERRRHQARPRAPIGRSAAASAARLAPSEAPTTADRARAHTGTRRQPRTAARTSCTIGRQSLAADPPEPPWPRRSIASTVMPASCSAWPRVPIAFVARQHVDQHHAWRGPRRRFVELHRRAACRRRRQRDAAAAGSAADATIRPRWRHKLQDTSQNAKPRSRPTSRHARSRAPVGVPRHAAR